MEIPGGRLILDLFLPTNLEVGATATKHWPTPQDQVITLEEKLVELDLLNQRTVSFLRYEKWQAGKLLQTELQRFPLRWYGVEEFKLMLENIGFTNIVLSADYHYGSVPTNPKQTLTYEAVRK